MTNLRLDLRFSLRQLAKAPGFTAVAISSLALGIAGTTVVFGVLDGLLLQSPAGVRAPEEVVRLYMIRREGVVRTPDGGPGSYADFQALQRGIGDGARVAAFFPVREYDHGLGSDARRARGRPVSGAFFPLLGLTPARGRLLDLGDDRPGDSRNLVVVSHGFWSKELGADPEIVGRSLLLNGEPFTVVGVTAPEFTGIETEPVDLWTPLGTAAASWYDRADVAMFEFLARIAPEADREQVRLSTETALAASALNHPELDPAPAVILGPLNSARGPHPSGAVRLAMGLWLATGFLLLVACANLANLLLARATTRSRELAVRRAVGAGQEQIVRQLLTESVVLALIGGAVGLALATAVSRLVQRLPELRSVPLIDLWLVGFTVVASLATGLLFGLVPAIQSRRVRPATVLNDFQPGLHPGAGRFARFLVAGQVALAVVLLVAGGLFIRSLQKVVTIDTGMDMDRLVVASLDFQSAGYQSSEGSVFYARGLEGLRALPEVEAASLVMPLPLSGRGWGVSVDAGAGGEPVRVQEGPYAYTVGEDFFRTAGIRILQGRPLTPEDRSGAESAAVVSERLAAALAPGGNAVGMCVPVGGEQKERGGCTRIVGVAANIRHRYLVENPMPYVYRSASQLPFAEGPSQFTANFLVRTAGDPVPQLALIRSTLQGIAPDLPYVDVQLLETSVGAKAVRPFRIAARLLTLFGSLALLLAAVGIYGTLTHFVADRAREVGVRMALGATRGKVLRLVIRRAMVPVAIGLVLGLAAAAAGAKLINAQLHGLSPSDPITFVLVIVTLVTAALIASWLPARRAASVDPILSLRSK